VHVSPAGQHVESELHKLPAVQKAPESGEQQLASAGMQKVPQMPAQSSSWRAVRPNSLDGVTPMEAWKLCWARTAAEREARRVMVLEDMTGLCRVRRKGVIRLRNGKGRKGDEELLVPVLLSGEPSPRYLYKRHAGNRRLFGGSPSLDYPIVFPIVQETYHNLAGAKAAWPSV
jgi:hypothetical protein